MVLFALSDSWQVDLALTKEDRTYRRVAMEFAVQFVQHLQPRSAGDPQGIST